MQEKSEKNFLVMKTVADVSKTLRRFEKGDMSLIPFSESNTTTETFRARYHTMRKKGSLNREFIIRESKEPKGTLLVCIN